VILNAAVQVVEQVGFDRLRVQDVADRAGVGLATIYRRWPTKHALVLATIARHHEAVSGPPKRTGDPRADLATVYRFIAERLASNDAQYLASFFAALRTERELLDAFRHSVIGPLREEVRNSFRETLGADDPTLELRTDLGLGLLMFRAMVGEPLEPERTDELVELVLGGDPIAPVNTLGPRADLITTDSLAGSSSITPSKSRS
jgi:AcrR family transcriptional regulator